MNKIMNITKIIGIVVILMLLVPATACNGNGGETKEDVKEDVAASPAKKAETGAQYARIINKENPGEEIDVTPFLAKGKTTVVDFYSEYCGPCVRIAPLLKQLDEKRDDIVVIKIDINRPGVSRIDWQSPAAAQYKLKSIPHFKIYGTSGDLEIEGNDAYKRVGQLLQESGVIPK